MKSLAFPFVAIAAAIAPRLAAQAPADTAQLADIVVTGTPVPTRAGAIAAAVTVLRADALAARGIRFVADALRDVPGFAVVAGGSYGAATSLFARGGESNYVKVLIDGVAVNQAGGGFDFATLSLDNVDRIEVVRGPASVVHGSDAVGGVVNVISRAGRGPLALRAAAEAGTFGSRSAEASAAGAAGPVSWSVGGGHLGTDGIHAFNNRFANSTAAGTVRAVVGEGTQLSMHARYGWNRYEFPTDGSGALADSNQYSRGHTLVIGAGAEHALSERVQLALALGATDTRFDFRDAPDHPGDTTGFGFASERRTDASRRSADLRAHIRAWRPVVVTAGAQVERLSERQSGWASSNFGDGSLTEDQPPFDAARTNLAGYLQATADLPSGLALNAGARHDDDEAFGGFTTLRAGAAYALGSGLRVRASAGTAFKTPSFAETFADAPFERGDRDLLPERTRTWEVGADQLVAGGILVLSASWFDQRFRDFIQYLATEPPAPTYVNVGGAAARGLELGVTLRPAAGLTVGAEYTRLLTEVSEGSSTGSLEFIDGEPLLRRPGHHGRVHGDYRFPGGAVIAVAVSAVGSRADIDFSTFGRVELEGYRLAEASMLVPVVAAEGGRPGLVLTARVENAFDSDHETIVGFPARGRAIFVGVRAGP
ncbi:MAG TPA: TonB-dependent receptor [Gemmatimonadales bacterium]